MNENKISILFAYPIKIASLIFANIALLLNLMNIYQDLTRVFAVLFMSIVVFSKDKGDELATSNHRKSLLVYTLMLLVVMIIAEYAISIIEKKYTIEIEAFYMILMFATIINQLLYYILFVIKNKKTYSTEINQASINAKKNKAYFSVVILLQLAVIVMFLVKSF